MIFGNLPPLRYATICSGIEAPSVAWGPLGWWPVFFSEIAKFPSAVLAHHHGDVPNLGDMTADDFVDRARAAGEFDVLAAGTPCQAFSVAGNRKSLGDDRGNLTLRFVEIVHALDPAFVLWENVPGVLSTADNAFGCFIAGMVGARRPLVCPIRDGRWARAGMVSGPVRSVAWRVLDAQYFALPQRRGRVFVVSGRTGTGPNPGAILFEPEGLPRHTPPSRKTRAQLARSLTASSGGPSAKEQQYTFIDGAGRPLNALPGGIARAVNGAGSRFGSGRDGQDTLVGEPAAVAYGIELGNQGTGGNRGYHDADEPSPTMHTSGPHGVAMPAPIVFQERTRPAGPTIETQEDLAYALLASAQGGRRQEMNIAAPIPFDTTQITSAANYSNPKPGDPCHPIAAMGHAPAITISARARGDDGRGYGRADHYIEDCAHSLDTVKPDRVWAPGMAIRRLTPLECERLQGFPDRYTRIRYPKKKPAKDGPRYTALGNSMAVPVIRWLGRRIALVDCAWKYHPENPQSAIRNPQSDRRARA